MGRIIIGIDPGQKGAVAYIHERNYVHIEDLPLLPNGEIDAMKLRHNIVAQKTTSDENDVFAICAIEKAQPMPSQSAQSGFNYGVGYGVIKTVITMLRIPFQEVSPAKWKKSFSLPKVGKGKGGKKKGKQEAITKCIELFPSVPGSMYYGPKGGMKDGRAEALLLAEYAKRCL